MTTKITKISKLNNTESFLQINTVKGYKYIDKAGEIVNLYHKGTDVPLFVMDLNGLTIQSPIDRIDELKITPKTFWMKSSTIDSLDMLKDIFSIEVDKVLKILDVTQISRIGWRSFFVYDFKNKEEQSAYFESLSVVDDLTPSNLRFNIKTNEDFDASVSLQPVKKEDKNNDIFGVLIDVDIFKSEEIDSSKVAETLKKFREYMSDDGGFLKIVNKTIE